MRNFNARKNKKVRHNKYLQIAQAEIDLHGFTKQEAAEALKNFIKNAYDKKYKRIRIITGKGLHSENGQSVLKGYVKSVLEKEGLNYSDSKIYDGGSGAIDVQM
ncbi:Smr/MutS family protein [Patescibacteria group bacterium]|nr:Smr/MutS family protein [Patescibacteria group bacterium]MBU4141532.1 Smr/MutS family protein [Patescibacteria group bacterium]MBU4338141.1 Smr/MutS family protein [Patescibacteria group bacterium]MBU4579399.1 Smr/MutS family protein [Patescibacteria group bacterium]